MNLRVAVHAGLRGGHRRVRALLDRGVAVAAVEAQLINVDLVGEGDRLGGLIADGERLGRGVVVEREGDSGDCGSDADGNFERQQIGPAGKNICHEKGDAVLGEWSL